MNFFEVSRVYLIILFVAAFILNLVILPYIFYKSNMLSKSFKILMVTFCVANVCHNLLDAIAIPRFFQREGLSVFYSGSLSPDLSKLAVCSLMAIFCVQIYNEFLHFLYRYIVLCRPNIAKLLTPKNVSILLIVTVPIYATAQGYLISMCADSVSPEIQLEIKEDFGESTPRSTAGLVYLYLYPDGTYNWPVFLVIGSFMGINVGFIIGMLACGIKIHSFIKKSLLSAKATAVHSTVFRMLIVEATLPLFILHIPAIVLMCGPIFFTVPRFVQDVLIELALSCPVLEPLTVIFFLSRRTKIFGKNSQQRGKASSATIGAL